jgi:predicted KAP-like P-loop ATPase
MRILRDHATEIDQYGFSVYCELLCSTILNATQDDLPFIIGILGDWGLGKSSLMKMMKKKVDDKKIKSLWFNPWKYDRKEELWSALIQSILPKI